MDNSKQNEIMLSPKSSLPTNQPLKQEHQEQVKEYLDQAKAENTKKAYSFDWKDFYNWCEEHGYQSLPADPNHVSAYLTDLDKKKGFKPSTIQRRIAAISQVHQWNGYPSPTQTSIVRTTFDGIKRKRGTRPAQKTAMTEKVIKAICKVIPDTPKGIRDRALILLGFHGGFRRSELLDLQVQDVKFTFEGMEILLRRSKTDQEGRGRVVGIPYGKSPDPKLCPVRMLKRWLDFTNIKEGSLFRKLHKNGQVLGSLSNTESIANIIKEWAEKAGFNPKEFAGHSLRRGFVTTSYKKKKSIHSIMKQTGHRSYETMKRYIEDQDVFEDNAADGLL
jgi:site-specific recombinase XerD